MPLGWLLDLTPMFFHIFQIALKQRKLIVLFQLISLGQAHKVMMSFQFYLLIGEVIQRKMLNGKKDLLKIMLLLIQKMTAFKTGNF